MGKEDYVLVNSFDLKEGMIIAKDIFMGETKLLNKHTELNQALIEKLNNIFSYNSVPVILSSFSAYDDKINDISEKTKFLESEAIFESISASVDEILFSLKFTSQPKLNNIREVSKNIVSNITDYTNALKSISNEREVDEYLVRHSVNVSVLSSMMGKWLNFSQKDITLLTYASLLHDIGKTKLPQKILNKTSKLTKDEFDIVKKHPIIAYEIIKKIPYMDSSVSLAVLMHHERIDGSGYPLGLRSSNISNFGKIVGIADMYDAMTSNKVYAKKVSAFKALDIMQKEHIDKLDPVYLNVFIQRISDYFTGEMVKLNNNSIGKIIKMDLNNISKPLILVKEEFIDLKEREDLLIEDILN